MININNFPDQERIDLLLKDLYRDGIKPLSIDVDFPNRIISIDYKHNDFIDLFGDLFNMNDVYILSPSAYRITKSFITDDNVTIKVTANIIHNEVVNKKMIKMWGCGEHAEIWL